MWIYFGSNRTGSWQIWRLPSGGGAAEQVTRDGGMVPRFTADSSVVYFSRWDRPGIWRQGTDPGAAPVQVLEDLGLFDWESWAVREDGLFYVSRASMTGPSSIRFHRFESGESEEVYGPMAAPWEPALAVSPDGRTLFVARIDRAESDIFVHENLPEGF